MFETGLKAGNVMEVVDAYEHALLGRFPRARYVVGYDITLTILRVLSLLPEWLSDWVHEKTSDNATPDAMKTGKYTRK